MCLQSHRGSVGWVQLFVFLFGTLSALHGIFKDDCKVALRLCHNCLQRKLWTPICPEEMGQTGKTHFCFELACWTQLLWVWLCCGKTLLLGEWTQQAKALGCRYFKWWLCDGGYMSLDFSKSYWNVGHKERALVLTTDASWQGVNTGSSFVANAPLWARIAGETLCLWREGTKASSVIFVHFFQELKATLTISLL